ncbi:MAG: sensor histidine kinase KdpD [Ignavibacteriae bacterium]|nr:sensor histidine kinase KdpD [Ignavibacteriota bacterium]
MDVDGTRPDPDSLLRSMKRAEVREKRGHLKIFFGMCAGVGKTYEMLRTAREALIRGTDVVVGYVETHGRTETEALLQGLETVPRRVVVYRGVTMEEMDLDAILARKPSLVLVDELAHTNAPESRHTKRYLDVLELLDNGIDVCTTLNVQHIESRADAVAQIAGIVVRETVPDSIFERADEVEVIDLPPDELLTRLTEGKVYSAERSERAQRHFFRRGNLTALRQMALRLAAERVDAQMREFLAAERIGGPWKTGQRLLVGITPGRDSVQLARWTKRLATMLRASWIAVFVERSPSMPPDQREQFARNIELARELGAEIITTADQDVAAALVRVAREQNATTIIVGRSPRLAFWRKNIVAGIMAQSRDVDVYVVGGDPAAHSRPLSPLAGLTRRSPVHHYGIAAAIVALLATACYPLAPHIGYQTVALVFLLAVTILPLRLGVGPVILASTLSALFWDYFFIPPRFTFAIALPQDMLMIAAYFTIAVVTGVLTVRVRTRERSVHAREHRASALYSLTHDLSSALDQNNVVHAAAGHIRKYLDADATFFLSDLDGDFVPVPHQGSAFFPDTKEVAVASWVHWNEKRAGKFTDTLSSADATYYPLSGPRYTLGAVGIRTVSGERLTLDQEILLENFLRQIATALDREFLNEMAKKSIALAESERLYTTLFNSISHEIRTPITALLGSAEALSDDTISGNPGLRRELVTEILHASERLDRTVQNLLAVTRLEAGRVGVDADWLDLRDVVNAAASELGDSLHEHPFVIDIAPAVPLIKADFTLLQVALSNLLRNAMQHTPAGTRVSVSARISGDQIVVTVEDEGPGFDSSVLARAFEKFVRGANSGTGGIGLGLTIARGFIEAHHGSLQVDNRPDGGARCVVRLPAGPAPRQAEGAPDEQ